MHGFGFGLKLGAGEGYVSDDHHESGTGVCSLDIDLNIFFWYLCEIKVKSVCNISVFFFCFVLRVFTKIILSTRDPLR